MDWFRYKNRSNRWANKVPNTKRESCITKEEEERLDECLEEVHNLTNKYKDIRIVTWRTTGTSEINITVTLKDTAKYIKVKFL